MVRRSRQPLIRSCALVLGLALASGQDSVEPAFGLKSKDPLVRLAAIARLEQEEFAGAEKLLQSALSDSDWEVGHRAASALAVRGTKLSVGPLVEFSLQAPTRRARAAAASSLAAIDASRGAETLLQRSSGKHALAAWTALGTIAPGVTDARTRETLLKAAQKVRRGKDRALRVAAAATFVVSEDMELEDDAANWLDHEELDVQAAAVEACGQAGRSKLVLLLFEKLARDDLAPVVERRVMASLCAQLAAGAKPDGTRSIGSWESAVQGLARIDRPIIAARCMRLARQLGALERDGGKPFLESAVRVLALGLSSADERVRAAAIDAGCALGDATIVERTLLVAREDPSPRVRRTAVLSLSQKLGARDPRLREVCGRLVLSDVDARVREEAAVALAIEGEDDVIEPLSKALSDADWAVSVCAAISLGKTRADLALSPLVGLLTHADWRRRGGAVTALTHWKRPACIEPMIPLLVDPDPSVASIVYDYFLRELGPELPPDPDPWRKWWVEHRSEVVFEPTEELRARLERYGYGVPEEAETSAESARKDPKKLVSLYDTLDVVVLDSRGDHIQELFARLNVHHRLTQAAHVTEAALRPNAIFVANCTGECEPADLERLSWFVRAGGYLFASCWALSETVEKIYPGVVRKFETQGEVLDDVTASLCAAGDPLLAGVFWPGGEPVYHLEGAHLIEVLDPERAEVLIDSPECAGRWGAGDLAAWFPAGHGLILDSVNHFDLQGLEVAPGVKSAEDRQAWALDHMGATYAEWRATKGEKWWSQNLKASERVVDLSAFRFLTNFVRLQRAVYP